MKKINPKYLPFIMGGVVVVLLLIGGGVFAYTKLAKPAEAPKAAPTKKRISDPVNVLEVAKRPYMQIVPTDANNLTIVVKNLKKPATEAEYELEYSASYEGSTILQGAFGDLSLSSIPAQTKTIFLGSCSAGGACTYHKDVTGGNLLTRFKGEENYALKSEWRFIDNKTRATTVSSKDAKFQLEAADLKSKTFIIIYNSPGYPEGLTGTPVSDPYSVVAAGGLKGSGDLTIRASEEGALTIMGWDGSAWKEFTTTVDGKSATAKVELMELYVVVKM